METIVLTPAHPRWNAFAVTLSEAITKQGCCNDYRLAEVIMTEMGGINVPDSIDFFQQHGGFCDCEILLNVDASFESVAH